MDEHRAEFIEYAVTRLKQRNPERAEQVEPSSLARYLDELIEALRHRDVPQEDRATSQARHAAQMGVQRLERGFDIASVAHLFGVFSEALGEVSQRRGVSFAAAEYGNFDACIDASVARAIESYHHGACLDAGQAAAKFVGFLAHELRNELWSARMSYTLMANGTVGLNSKTGGVLTRSLRRMESLVSETMAAVQLESAQPAEPRKLLLGALLDEVQAAAFPERGIVLSVTADRSLEVMADERLLGSAINNLVQNALKFTHDGGRVEVRARRDGDRVVIEVEDECGGLAPGKAEAMFQPFAQHHENRSGLGLGLSITQRAVEAHGGELTVRSLPDKGCIFRIRQPLEPTAVDAGQSAPVEMGPPPGSRG